MALCKFNAVTLLCSILSLCRAASIESAILGSELKVKDSAGCEDNWS